jgi:hypothetical protein
VGRFFAKNKKLGLRYSLFPPAMVSLCKDFLLKISNKENLQKHWKEITDSNILYRFGIYKEGKSAKRIRNLGKRIGSKGRAQGPAFGRRGPPGRKGGRATFCPGPREAASAGTGAATTRKGKAALPAGGLLGTPGPGPRRRGAGRGGRPFSSLPLHGGEGERGRRPAWAINGRLRTGADKGNPTV